MAALCLTLVACASRQPAPTSAEPAAVLAIEAPARSRARVPLVTLERPAGLTWFDVESAEAVLAQTRIPRSTFPPAPVVPAPGRPSAGGEALELADLALTRGDPLDAAFQYRAMIANLDPTAATYVRLQLARAYVALDDRARARPLLRSLAEGHGVIAWAALVVLAELDARENGPREALLDLQPLARSRFEALADHLINRASGEDVADLLVDKADRLGRCDYAFEAIARDRSIQGARLGACRTAVETEGAWLWARADWSPFLDFYRQLNRFADRWDLLAEQTRQGSRDPEPWVIFAEDLMSTRPLAAEAGRASVVSAVGRAALRNAIELALAREQPDRSVLPRVVAISERLDPQDRDLVQRHIQSLLTQSAAAASVMVSPGPML